MSKYQMTLSLGVIDHLGLNLYSNIPAVMSELVANAWDADAKSVTIEIDTTRRVITITDDGHGMSESDVNKKFLTVGYRRREHGPTETASGRHVMGRKGIGKLSIFSIANEVEVQTAQSSTSKAALILKTAGIRDAIEDNKGAYSPDSVDVSNVNFDRGTRLILKKLRRRPNKKTGEALRRRLARRFSIIGSAHDFSLTIDGQSVGVQDRDYFQQIEYLWSIGDVGDTYEQLAASATQKTSIDGVIDATVGYEASGWIGTASSHSALEEGDNSLVVLAWGKLIHEDIIKDIKAGGLYTKYLIGEIRADFLDDDGKPDIVTSDRQSLKEDDDRFSIFKTWIKDTVLRTIENSWRDWRREASLDRALENEVVEEWYKDLKGDNKRFAKDLFGRIGGFPLEDEDDRSELYKHTILAFERLRFRDCLREIEKIEAGDTLIAFRALFHTVDDLEAAEYHRISLGRLEVINLFEGLVDDDAKERVIQEHLFDHLWLLDPSWERASSVDARMEKTVGKIFDKVVDGLTEDEKNGRIDIAVRTAANKYVVVELKRYSVTADFMTLLGQLSKYRDAFTKTVQEKFPDEDRPVELVAVLGNPPKGPPADPKEQAAMLASIDARWVTYDSLIAGAQARYQEYVEATKRVSRISELLDRL